MKPIHRLKLELRNAVVTVCRWMGSDICDAYTGEKLTRGLVCAWEGRVHVIGADVSLIPVPVMQNRMTYWRQFIGFTTHPEVNFPRCEPAISLLKKSPTAGAPSRVLVVVLDHRDPKTLAEIIALWFPKFCKADDLLIAYGGLNESFDQIAHSQRIFIDDTKLRTRDHQREAQSYRGVFKSVSNWMADSEFTHVLFMEGDHVPLAQDLIAKYLGFMEIEDADVLGYHLARIDGTLHPHWLASGVDPTAGEVMLSMLGTGHFWKREAWDAVAADDTRLPRYLELDLPTTAHTLGFRLRPLPNPGNAIMALPSQLKTDTLDAAAAGAWSIHPIK